MNISKHETRASAIRRRDQVEPDIRTLLARRMAELGTRLVLEAADGQRVTSLYDPIGSEPDPGPLAASLREAGISLALPVDWSSGSSLVYRRWTPGDRLAPGPLGIGEPLEHTPACEPDILIMPALAFDRSGNRLGYGAGNVDQTLQVLRARKAIQVVAVAFAAQEEALVPTEPHDQRVDLIITELELIDCRR